MSSFAQFARDIRTITFQPGTAGAEIVSEELATFARAELARVINSGEGSPIYDLFVNGREAASESGVEVPGAIVYVFSWWNEVIAAALTELISRSPKKSGRYANSFVVLVNNMIVAPGTEIPASATVTIVNAQPYTRKIEVGAMVMNVPPRHFETTRRVMSRRFGSDSGFRFRTTFLNLPSGIHPLIPYKLRGEYAQKRSAWLSVMRSGGGRHGMKRFPRRSSLDAGKPISYPALVMQIDN